MLPCVFLYWARNAEGQPTRLIGIMAVHVDDLITAGNAQYETVLTSLRAKLSFGKWEQRTFEYTGRLISQDSDFSIRISQPHYAGKIPLVPISREQIRNDSQPITDETLADMRRTTGSACWLSKSTRPDLSFEVSYIQQALTTADYSTVKMANRMVKRAQDKELSIRIQGIDLAELVILGVSDASPGKMPRSGSQGGFFIFATTPKIHEGMTACSVLSWSSHRLKRVARSSLATESMGLCEASEHAEFARVCLQETLAGSFDFKNWEDAALDIPMVLVTDAKSVFDHITAERGLPSDRMLALDLAALRDTFEGQIREDLMGRNAILKWLPGSRNIADGLTKYLSIQDLMTATLSTAQYTIADDDCLVARAAAMKEKHRENRRNRKQKHNTSDPTSDTTEPTDQHASPDLSTRTDDKG